MDRINELVAGIMEPKPEATKTYAEHEREDAEKGKANYSCWDITSPGGWWEISIDWGEDRRTPDLIPDWMPAKNPAEEIEAAWEVEEKMKENVDYIIYLVDIVDTENNGMFALVHATPLQRCLAALRAHGIEVGGGENSVDVQGR